MTACAWEACSGEAHSNPHIDNCNICAPRWGRIPVCPEHGERLDGKNRCPACEKQFIVED